MTSIKLCGWFVVVLALTSITACTQRSLDLKLNGAFSISGKVDIPSGLTSFSNTIQSCTATTVRIYELDSNGFKTGTALDSTLADAQGFFKFDDLLEKGVNLTSTNLNYMLEVETCSGNLYYRPVAGDFKQQNVSLTADFMQKTLQVASLHGTTILSIEKSALSAYSQKLEALGATNFQQVYTAVTTHANLNSEFQALFGIAPTALSEMLPVIAPPSLATAWNEGQLLSAAAQAEHWNVGYSIVYKWRLDGVDIGSASNLNYTFEKNNQGLKILQLRIGKDNGSGGFDSTAPIYTKNYQINVADTYPPLSPALTRVLPTGTHVGSRNLTLRITTGTALSACESFSSLALTENDVVPPLSASSFNITCTTAPNQDLMFPLSTTGDGQKVLRLWARDSAGHVSTTPTILNVDLDELDPAVTLQNLVGAFKGGSSVNVSYSVSDGSGIASAVLQYAANGTSFNDVVTLDPDLTSVAWTLPSDNTTTAKIRVVAVDEAGRSKTVTSSAFTIDSQAPSALILTRTSNQISNSRDVSLAVSGCTGDAVSMLFKDTNTLPTTTDLLWETCDTSKTYTVASGDGAKSIYAFAKDAVGNISPVSSAVTMTLDQTLPVIAFGTINPLRGNSNLGSVSWTLTELNVAASTSFSVDLWNGTSWSSVGTRAATAGSNTATSYSLTNWAVPNIDISTARLRITITDAGGNTTVATSGNVVIDKSVPTLVSTVINNNANLTISTSLIVKVNATDTLSGVTSIRIASAQVSDCQAAYADNNWRSFTNGGGVQSYSFVTTATNGPKKVCVWAKDSVGNVSRIESNLGQGDDGVDTDSITLDQGSAPLFTSLTVKNNRAASPYFGTTNFENGDQVKIEFTVTDDVALATNPVSLQLSTNNTNYNEIVSYSAMGSPGVNQTTWTYTYTGYTATGTSFFRFRLVGKDANGNTAQVLSAPLNTGKWSVFAGNNDLGNGASALAARIKIRSTDSIKNAVAINTRNEIFIAGSDAIRKIDPSTGNISNYITISATEFGVPGTITTSTLITSVARSLYMDGNDLYLNGLNKIYRINTLTNEIEVYLGGGTDHLSTDVNQVAVWEYGGLTMDPATKDIYFMGRCSNAGNATNSSIRIRKVTQDPISKRADVITDFAGNCVKGNAIHGADKMQTPLENSIYWDAHSSLVYVPSTQALYFAGTSQKMNKIIGGKLYTTTDVSNSWKSGIYIASQNRVYFTERGRLLYFVPTATQGFDENLVELIANEATCTDVACRNDTATLNNAGVLTNSVFEMAGQIGIVDNTLNQLTVVRLRVYDPTTSTLQTIAGTDRFSGDGKDRTLARFASIGSLVFKPSATLGFPAGLYAIDAGSSRLLHMSPSDQLISIKAGSGISAQGPETGATFGTGLPLGPVGASGFQYSLILNNSGLFIYSPKNSIANVKSDGTVDYWLKETANTNIYNASAGVSGNGYKTYDGENLKGMTIDGANNVYFGGYSTSMANKNKIMVRKSDGKFYTVIGSVTNATSSDCTTPGCAATSSINCASGQISCRLGEYDRRYNNGEGRLLFVEGTKIRFVSKAYDLSNSTLGTLKNSSNVAIDVGRTIMDFHYIYVDPTDTTNAAIDRFYYIGSDGRLYCYKVNLASTATCNNSNLGPNSPLETLGLSTIARDPSTGDLFFMNSNNDLIYKYTP